MRSEGFSFVSTNVSTDSRKRWRLNSNPSYSKTTAGGQSSNLNLSATIQPSTRVNISFGPSYNLSQNKFQYVTAVTDPTATTFSGQRYVLSDVRQKQLRFDTRLNVTFSPTMTLELYAQPLLASGHYSDFKEFDAPRRAAYSVYGRDRGTVQTIVNASGNVQRYSIDPDGAGPANSFVLNNPDFNFRSLRGSVVYRWEYRPGSALYVVWTQQRSDQAPVGDFDFARDRTALLSAHPDNILLVKASWWLSR